MKFLIRFSLTLTMIFLLSACSGGGGGSEPDKKAVWDEFNWDDGKNWQ